MPLPFTSTIFNSALQDRLREQGYHEVEADISGIGTCTILDYNGKTTDGFCSIRIRSKILVPGL